MCVLHRILTLLRGEVADRSKQLASVSNPSDRTQTLCMGAVSLSPLHEEIMGSTYTQTTRAPGDKPSSDERHAPAHGASPVVHEQSAANEYAFPKSDDAGKGTALDGLGTTVTLQVVKGRFAGARDAVASRYRDASQSTDDFVRHNPWKSIAYATLGGIIVDMLAAR